MQDFLQITKALSDETRARALMALQGRELCLCQIIDLLGLAPSTVSKHMTVLQQAGLVTRRKQGRWHFYRLADDAPSGRVRRTLDWAVESLDNSSIIAGDQKTLADVCSKDLGDLSACYKN